MNVWRSRWERAVTDLTTARAENDRLRAALDELNREVEQLFDAAGQGGIEAAKSHAIKTMRAQLRKRRAA